MILTYFQSFAFNVRETKMTLLSPFVNELTLLDEQRKEWDDKISEVCLRDKKVFIDGSLNWLPNRSDSS